MKFSHKLTAVAMVASMALVGCGSSDGDGGDAAPTTEAGSSDTTEGSETTEGGGGGGGDAVTIVDFAYDPDPLEVTAGAAVTFTNEDSAVHTATSKGDVPKDFDTGELAPGDSKEITFDEAGTYTYFCEIHDYMKSSVEVK